MTLFCREATLYELPCGPRTVTTCHQNVHSLENEVKNWCKELKEEKNKVGQQLQIFGLAFKGINQRRLVTRDWRLSSRDWSPIAEILNNE